LFCNCFPEGEIELRRKIIVLFRAPASKMARYRPAITAPKPEQIAPKTRFPKSNQRQSPNHKRQIWPSIHDLSGQLYLQNSKNRSDVF
jgi:hypothetical protein